MTTERRELVGRIWSRDPTVWTGTDEARWLGWLDEPFRMREDVEALLQLADDLREDTDEVVLLGMGGSSLAAEVFRRAFSVEGFHVLDTTHPQAIRSLTAKLDLSRTLFVPASKSGSTVETRSQADYFWKLAPRGAQWVAITDPGSPLASLAHERSFATVVPGEPTIGGRYSALSPFGLLPAALMGIDVISILDRACAMADACRLDDGNPGLELGLSLGEQWREGRDKVCVPDADGFGSWVEQLVAESTGKHGKGLLPVPGDSGLGPDRQVQEVHLDDPLELGAEFFRWEFATAVAGAAMRVNPFDQPDVQAAKDRTNAVLEAGDTALELAGSLDELLAGAAPPDYLCLQAYLDPTAEHAARLASFAERFRARSGCAVTAGFGPGYLHSTGQLHKGGPNTGRFLQVIEDYGPELAIPGKPFGFAQLIRAQAAGDLEALRERDRRVARVTLDDLD